MRKKINKIIPDRLVLEKNKALKPISRWLVDPKIWHFNRRSISMGIAIGMFFGVLPIAGQMLLSAIISIVVKANMPISMAFTWISNPFTMPFLYTANYYFGVWLLQIRLVNIENINWSLKGILELGGEILQPLFLGSLVVGVILAIISFIAVRLLWRIHIISYLHSRKDNKIKGRK